MGDFDLLSEFDPLQQKRKEERKSSEVFDPESIRFAELTGLDQATGAVHLRAAKLKGMGFEEAVDRFYQNNKAHVREGEQVDRQRMAATRQKAEVTESDAALARALAEEDKDREGYEASPEELVAQLEEMGFEKGLALQAARTSKTLRDAADFCVGEEAPAEAREAFALEGERRRDALSIEKGGKLFKLSRASSVLGARWQSRAFSLKSCQLTYVGDHKKMITVWDCYAVRQRDKVLGKEHAFALYAGPAPPTADAKPLALLAADDRQTAKSWLQAISLASGRPGHLLRVGDDGVAANLRCSCTLPADVVDRELSLAVSESNKVVVTKVSGVLEKLGLRVDDEIVSVDDLPAGDSKTAKALALRAPRPFEMHVRRRHHRSTDHAVSKWNQPPQVPVLDLLSLDVDDEIPSQQQQPPPLPAPPPREDDAHVQAVSLVQAALDARARATQLQDPVAARHEYTNLVQTLLAVQPSYASDPAVRDAVAAAFPDLSLAHLYNEAVAASQRLDALITQPPLPEPPQPPPPPVTPTPDRPTHKAAYAFDATEPWQLSVAPEEPLTVVEVLPDGWSDCVNANRHRGLVPSSYVVEFA
ncbi:hypothetical protein CTAYLR_002986 [Chrysophaeum taylorii]|uniref:Uncharacterized protein n=1 Tax=Chrysophaeum taylorii TaxID=2483200 RepID=A0AAD7XHC3_9STRA|nr:hypothetical protein CTAYLR_002986 [Chrysophaeum taylorii]